MSTGRDRGARSAPGDLALAPATATSTNGSGGGDPGRYAGLATRVVAFAVDAAIISVVAIVVAIGVGLILVVLHFPRRLDALVAVIGGVGFVLWCAGYFTAFWSSAGGQTPGARFMQIRVVTAQHERLKPRRALLRCVGVVLAALPLFAGFVLVLFDGQRRGFQDRFARTLVVHTDQLSVAAGRKARMQTAYTASRSPSRRQDDPVDRVEAF